MTGGDIPVLDVSYVAGQDLSNYQFRAVKIFTDGTVKLCGTGDAMIGILQNDPPLVISRLFVNSDTAKQ